MAGAIDLATVWRAPAFKIGERIWVGTVGVRKSVAFMKTGQHKDHGLGAPFGQLSECHRRIEGFLTVLLTVADSKRGGTLAEADREILTAGLHYFRAVIPRHAADEEHSLFPRLRSSADPHAKAAIRMVERLEADHRVVEDHQDAVDVLGRRWLRQGRLPADDARALREHLVALERLYRGHIAVEDHELFPLAQRLLTPAELGAIGHEMVARRKEALM